MIGGFFGALLPTTTATNPALQRGDINTRNPTIAGGNTSTGTTRQNLMMDDLMYGNNARGLNNSQTGFFNDLQQFQQLNPHGDFGENTQNNNSNSHTASPVIPSVPPSEENIAALMVCTSSYLNPTLLWVLLFLCYLSFNTHA